MFFNLFRNKGQSKRKRTAALEGFQSLVMTIKQCTDNDMSDRVAVLLVLRVVDFSIRVLVNVSLEAASPFVVQYPLTKRPKRRSKSHFRPQVVGKSGRRSVHSRPICIDSLSLRSDDESCTSGDDSFSFGRELKEKGISFEKVLKGLEMEAEELYPTLTSSSSLSFLPKLSSSASLRTVPEHALLKGFVRTSSGDPPDPPKQRRHSRHLSLDDENYLPDLTVGMMEKCSANPPSPFLQADCGKLPDMCFDKEKVDMVESLLAPQDSDDLKIKADFNPKISTASSDSTKQEMELKTEFKKETSNESPSSSPRSNFSDSVAAKFVNSNFCNPEFNEDPVEAAPAPSYRGSIRQRYTMKRLQSLLSQRSRVSIQSPSDQISVTPRWPPLDSTRSYRGRSFKGVSSFRSRGDEEGNPVLSDAYRLVRLESCIRKAWKVSMDDAKPQGSRSFKDSECKKSLSSSFKKLGSRRFERKISFVKVPADFSSAMDMMKSQMMLNPAYGDEDIQDSYTDSDSVNSEEESVLDTSSVVMRTPLRRMGSTKPEYKTCEKNPEEGAYDNPLRMCSFRSYDSDTELELASVRVRNPISRLLSYRVSRGLTKDGIALAEIDDDEYGAMVFEQVNSKSIQNGMLDKYLTQLVIDDALDAKMVGDIVDPDEDDVQWSTCQSAWVPQELDEHLKCFLLDRFLLDNVLNEMDVNLGALELARVQSKRIQSKRTSGHRSSRKLRRS